MEFLCSQIRSVDEQVKELARNAFYILKYKTEFETFKGLELKKKYRWPRPADPDFLKTRKGVWKLLAS